jgi:hypothetical protein
MFPIPSAVSVLSIHTTTSAMKKVHHTIMAILNSAVVLADHSKMYVNFMILPMHSAVSLYL